MAIITKITTQKKNKERYNIFLDDGKGERYAFSVHEEILLAHRLQKGNEIDEFDIEEISFADDVSKSFNHAVAYLSYRMRSTQEVMQHLRDKEYSDAVIQEAIHKLNHVNYLNDEAFSIAYVRTNSKLSLKGPILLQQELNQKGISLTDIDSALAHYSEEDQHINATKLADKVVNKTTSSSEKMQKQKISESLMRKGFPREIINDVIRELAPKEGKREEEWTAICQTGAKAHRRYQKYEEREYKRKMKQHLYQKGFSVELIDKYFNSEEYSNESRDVDF